MKCSTCKKTKESLEFIKPNNKFFKTCSDCRAYQKSHYKNNKSEILKSRSDKISCKCGSVISRGNMTNHIQSKKHQRYLDYKDKKPEDRYYYKFWESRIHGVTYYYQSKTKTKMITCYCGSKFYASQSDFDKHIMSSHHLYFEDILRHSKPYNDEYILYEKIKY